MDTHKHGNNEKLSINIFFLFTCKRVIWKKIVRNQNFVFIVLSLISTIVAGQTVHCLTKRLKIPPMGNKQYVASCIRHHVNPEFEREFDVQNSYFGSGYVFRIGFFLNC